MRSLGIQGDTVTLLTSGGIGVVQFLAVFPAILFIDRLGEILLYVSYSTLAQRSSGRKPLLIGNKLTIS